MIELIQYLLGILIILPVALYKGEPYPEITEAIKKDLEK